MTDLNKTREAIRAMDANYWIKYYEIGGVYSEPTIADLQALEARLAKFEETARLSMKYLSLTPGIRTCGTVWDLLSEALKETE